MATLTLSNITSTQDVGLSIKTEGSGFVEIKGNGFRAVGWPCDVVLSTSNNLLWFLEVGQFQFGPMGAGMAKGVSDFLAAELADVGIDWQNSSL